MGQPQVAQLSVEWDGEEGAYDGLHRDVRQRCTTCSRRVSASIWSRTPTAGRPQCGCGCPSLLSCTVVVVAERWTFHTALARAPRSALAHQRYMFTPLAVHTRIHTIHTLALAHTLVHTLCRSICTHRPTAPPSWAPRRRESRRRQRRRRANVRPAWLARASVRRPNSEAKALLLRVCTDYMQVAAPDDDADDAYGVPPCLADPAQRGHVRLPHGLRLRGPLHGQHEALRPGLRHQPRVLGRAPDRGHAPDAGLRQAGRPSRVGAGRRILRMLGGGAPGQRGAVALVLPALALARPRQVPESLGRVLCLGLGETTRSTPSPAAAPNTAMVPDWIASTGPARTPHNPCCGVPEATISQALRASSQKAGTMHRHAKRKIQQWSQTDCTLPPSGLARRLRRIHTKSTTPTTPAATDSTNSGYAVLKW